MMFSWVILILLIFIFLTIFIMKIEWNRLYHIYLAVVSFVSIVAVAITLWVVLTSVWKYFIISDEEYLQNQQSWKLENCSNPTYAVKEVENNWDENKNSKLTQEEISQCEDKVRTEVSFSRKYNLKDTFISSFSWLLVFIVLFWFHYPKFLKSREQA